MGLAEIYVFRQTSLVTLLLLSHVRGPLSFLATLLGSYVRIDKIIAKLGKNIHSALETTDTERGKDTEQDTNKDTEKETDYGNRQRIRNVLHQDPCGASCPYSAIVIANDNIIAQIPAELCIQAPFPSESSDRQTEQSFWPLGRLSK